MVSQLNCVANVSASALHLPGSVPDPHGFRFLVNLDLQMSHREEAKETDGGSSHQQ